MPKVSLSAFKRVKEFPDCGLESKNGKLWCRFCNEEVDFQKKSKIETHIKTSKHLKGKASLVEALVNQPRIDNAMDANNQWKSMTEAFVAAGVPLHIFRKGSSVHDWMTKNVKNGAGLPSETSLRRILVNSGQDDMQESIRILKLVSSFYQY